MIKRKSTIERVLGKRGECPRKLVLNEGALKPGRPLETGQLPSKLSMSALDSPRSDLLWKSRFERVTRGFAKGPPVNLLCGSSYDISPTGCCLISTPPNFSGQKTRRNVTFMCHRTHAQIR
jgi:hypothetical protein